MSHSAIEHRAAGFTSPFPRHVAFVDLHECELGQLGNIAEAELRLLSDKASPRRVKDFTLGRLAARKALTQLGLKTPPPVLMGTRGEPLWPKEIVGSLTHSAGRAIAVASPRSKSRSLGIDLQLLHADVRPQLQKRICLPREALWCEQNPEMLSERVLSVFSVKESIFKTLYPLCRRVFYFHDAELHWDADEVSCTAVLQKELGPEFPRGFTLRVGRRISKDFLLTFSELGLS